MDGAFLLPAAAFALDLIVGDPPAWPHPVRLLGVILERLERVISPASPAKKRFLGLVVTLCLSLGVFGLVRWLTAIPWAGGPIALVLAFWGLALGQLLRETRNVSSLLQKGRLEEARLALAMLVSRETAHLDEAGLWRTLAETLSENFCDGFVAPYFFLCLGGVPLLWVYKTVSTMDSMWGYKTARYADMGWAGARADDLLAFVPARLAGLSLLAAGALMGSGEPGRFAGLGIRRTLRAVRIDARKMASPNAGWPMAAAAWLCGATMGGQAFYFGESVEKPRLGPPDGAQWNFFRLRLLERVIIWAAIGIATLFLSIFSGDLLFLL